MTARLVLPPGTDRDTWQSTRQRYIGGSDIAAILNISPYDGPMTTWMEKVHGRRKPMNDAMSIGLHMEPWIVGKLGRVHRDWAIEAAPGMYAADDDLDANGNMWRSSNPDGIATLPNGARVLIEAKTAMRYGDESEVGWGDEDTDEIPHPYLCQVTWNCALLGCSLWIVPVLFLDSRLYCEYRGRFEPKFAETLINHGRNWWNQHVIGGAEPAADYRASTKQILNERFVEQQPTRKTFAQIDDANALIWQAEYVAIRDKIKSLKEQQAERANLLRQSHVRVDAEELRHGERTISTMTRTKTGSVRLLVKECSS